MEKRSVIKKLKVYSGLFVLVASLSNLKIDTAQAATNYGNLRTYIDEGDDFTIESYDIILHTVEKNETIYSIAQKYGVTVQEIIDANVLKEGYSYTVYPGEEMIVKKVLSYDKKQSELSIYNEQPAQMTFSINDNGEVYVKITSKFSKQKENFLNKKVSQKLKTNRTYKVNGLEGKTIDITNINYGKNGRIDDFIFLQDNGTLQLLDIDKLYNEGVIVATDEVYGYNECMRFQQDNAYVEGKKREVRLIGKDYEKSVPTYKEYKRLKKTHQDPKIVKTYKDLNIDTSGSSRLEFSVSDKGEVYVNLTEQFGTDYYNYESDKVLSKVLKDAQNKLYKVKGLEGKVLDVANIHYGKNGRIDDYVFLLDNGQIQLLDIDKLYNEGVIELTNPVYGYNNCTLLLPGQLTSNGIVENIYVQILDNNEIRNIPTYEDYSKIYSPYKCKVLK